MKYEQTTPDFMALAESLDGKRMEFCGDTPALNQAVDAMRWAAQEQDKERASAFQQALDIRTAQGWTLGGKAVPVLYTDTINGEQVLRDDVWLCTTEALKPAPQPADAPDGTDDLVEALKLALEYWAHRQQRYKNRSPVWVQRARAAIAKVQPTAPPTLNASKDQS